MICVIIPYWKISAEVVQSRPSSSPSSSSSVLLFYIQHKEPEQAALQESVGEMQQMSLNERLGRSSNQRARGGQKVLLSWRRELVPAEL